MMPEINGMELYSELTSKTPALAERILFLTGGAFTPSTKDFLDRVHNPCVEKPFEGEVLRRMVGTLLA